MGRPVRSNSRLFVLVLPVVVNSKISRYYVSNHDCGYQNNG